MWQRFNFVMSVVKIPWIAYLLALLMAGCSSAIGSVSPDNPRLSLLLGLTEFDLKSFQPSLPDDLKPKPEMAPLPPPIPGDSGEKALGSARVSKPESPVIYYYPAPTKCPPCRRSEADQITMPDFEFRLGLPDEWSRKHATSYPYFRWKINGMWTGETHGWSGSAHFREVYRKSLRAAAGGNTASLPGPSDAPAAVFSTGHLWTIAALREHLAREHHCSRRRVASMSDSEVLAAHAKAHGW